MFSDLNNLFALFAPAFLIFVRIGSLFLVAPGIGSGYLPVRTKLFAALAVTIILLPLHIGSLPAGFIGLPYAALIAKELMVGFSIGLLMVLFFQGVRFGGDLIGRTAGFSAAESFDNSTGGMRGPIGETFYLCLLLLFFITDGHHYFIQTINQSFKIVPVGAWTCTAELQEATAVATKQLFEIAITIAFPTIAVIMAIVMAEGVIARTIPQINLMHITFAVKILVALFVIYFSLPAAVLFLGKILEATQTFVTKTIPTMT